MAVRKEPVISVEFLPNTFVHLNYYQVSSVLVTKNESEEILKTQFTMTNNMTWEFTSGNAEWAYSQYQRILNKEND